MKKIKLILSLLLFCFSASAVYTQAILLNSNTFVLTEMVGDTCQGTGTIKYDDGVFSNGATWSSFSVTDGRMVLKFTPASYPWTFNKFCIALTRLVAGTLNRSYDIVVYDTTGAGGAPGTVVYTLPGQTATDILVYPQYSWYSYPLSGVPPLNSGSYYIGVKYNPAVSGNNHFVMFDEAPTPLRTGYAWANAGPWTTAQTYHGTYTCWGMRTDGVGPPSLPVTNRCRNGLNLPILDHSTIADSVQVTLGNICLVRDVNVRIDTLVHTWDSDITIYLRKGTIGINIVDNVGGSGDNFINTVLNDSATSSIASGVAPFTGQFRPSNPLAIYNSLFTDGYWKLVITDTATADTGILRAWCVVIAYDCQVGGIQTVEIPNYYSLSQNYPNPFNPSTVIKFTMPKGDNVKLVVFDVLGREVRTLVNEYRSSGVYEVNFDASVLSSGVYFYRLEAGDYTATKRMLLVK